MNNKLQYWIELNRVKLFYKISMKGNSHVKIYVHTQGSAHLLTFSKLWDLDWKQKLENGRWNVWNVRIHLKKVKYVKQISRSSLSFLSFTLLPFSLVRLMLPLSFIFRGQFHQHSTSSFYARRSRKRKN